ncbi:MAG: glycosyltransferase [Desulfosarcinaceae bacterium]|nr:glycosyltransferase [Desulfosarcinaceae bacterium]
MRFILCTYGTRGDVQPILALALGLAERGHTATVAGPPEWQTWATSRGCSYVPVGGDLRPFLQRVAPAHRPRPALAFRRLVMEAMVAQFEKLPRLIAAADVSVGASLCLALPSVAEALQTPYRYVGFTPQILPSKAHPCPIFRHQRGPAWLNRLGWQLNHLLQRFDLLPTLNRHRRRLALPSLRSYWRHLLGPELILACDSELAAVPADAHLPVTQTGYPHLEKRSPLPAEEAAFLAAGSPPLFAGFGSMSPAESQDWLPLVVAAARASGRRLVLQADPETAARYLPQNGQTDLLVRPHFRHLALFPRMAAVIHHGGAGTTATAARSGVPQIVVPHILDQFYWGERIWRRGLGPAPLQRTRLTVRRLARAIEACLHEQGHRGRARQIAMSIDARDAIQSAVNALVSL